MDIQLARVVDALPGLVWTARSDGTLDFVNHRWCEYTGLSVDEARGAGWQTVIHPDDLPDVLERWQSIVGSGELGEIEARLKRVDGNYRWFLLRTSPLTDASEVGKWCGVSVDIDDRRRIAETARADESRFRSIVDELPALVALMSPDGGFAFANRRLTEYCGGSRADMSAWASSGVIHPDDLPQMTTTWMAAVASGTSYDIEHRIRRHDGVYRWFDVHGAPLRDANGGIALWHIALNDIDDRKRAEALMAGEKHLLEMIASGRALPDVLTALCNFFEQASDDCLCGVYPIDWSGPTFQHAVAPSLPASYLAPVEGLAVALHVAPCGIAALVRTQVIVEDIESDPRWDASTYRAHVLAHGLRSVWSTPIHSLDGHVLGTFCIYRRTPATPSSRHQELIAQVTHIASIAIDGARSEAALKRSEAFLAEAQRLSLTGSFGWSVADDGHFWSAETFRIFAYDPSTTVTIRSILERVHPQDLHLVRQVIAKAVDGHDFDYECRLVMPGGAVKHVHVVAHGTRDQDGRVEYIGAIQDVTAHRLSEGALGKVRSELAHVARVTSLGALTASIAHEVNQPLSGIITNASTCLRMLAADPPNVDGARETARRTIRDGNRASDVITRLRALFTKQDAATESVDLNEATREVIALSRTELQRNRAMLRMELDDDLPPVTGDRVQLQQVIMNLLLNASDSMVGVDDRPRHLVVRTECDGEGRVRFSVRDAGIGVEPQVVDKLFDAFYTTKPGGMGIGLSVSRSIVDRHQGRLWAIPNDGPGATFSFSLPPAPQVPTRATAHGTVRVRAAAADATHAVGAV